MDALRRDADGYGDGVELVHLKSVGEARTEVGRRGQPFYVVGTVPDLPPESASEVEARDILEYAFSNARAGGDGVKGVLLDMCFKPRRTRTIKLAESYGWVCVEGTGVIGYQIEEQYRPWCTTDNE